MGSKVMCQGAMGIRKHLSLVFVALLACNSLASDSAQQLLAAGRVDDAVVALNAETQANPSDADAYNLLCRAHLILGNWDRGIAACEKAVALRPENSSYHLWLGRIYGEKADKANFLTAAGLAGKVRTEFEKAVELSPDNVAALSDLAEFYLKPWESSAAAATKQKLRPGHWLLWIQRKPIGWWAGSRRKITMPRKQRDNTGPQSTPVMGAPSHG